MSPSRLRPTLRRRSNGVRIAALVAAAALALGACGDDGEDTDEETSGGSESSSDGFGSITVQLSWIKNAEFAGEFIADDKGYVKMPNVNVLLEMADMTEANRSYEANLQVVKQARSLISMTIDLMRSQ